MNITFRLCLCISFTLLGLLSPGVFAQGQDAGFFTLVNAVDLPTNTIVSVDGKALRADGLKPGKVTGALGFVQGSHRIDATNKDCKPAAASIQVEALKPQIVILYLVHTLGPGGRPMSELRISSQPSTAKTDSRAFAAIYVGQNGSEALSVNGQSRILRPLQEVFLGKVSSVSIAQNNVQIGTFRQEAEPGNYLIVLFDKQDSHPGALLVQDADYKVAGRKR
jgi:hypothetical protein